MEKSKERHTVENNEKILSEALAYFHRSQVFQKLFLKFREKYISLGHFGGSVTLTGLTAEEKMALGGFLQKDYTKNRSITVSAERMEKILAGTRFSSLTWDEILEAYFDGPIQSKKELLQKEENARTLFFQVILDEFRRESTSKASAMNAGKEEASATKGTEAVIKKQLTKHNVEQWLQNALRDKNNTWKILLMQYQTNPEQLRLTLLAVMRAVFLFPAPKHYSSLPVFAADTTRDPHFFDTGTPGERLLTAFLAEHFPEEIPESGKNAEWHNRLYYRAGILRDDLSNDVLTYGIHASTENGPHPGIEGFLQMKEPMRLTLNTVSRLVKVCPQNPDETLVRWFTREHIFIKDRPAFVFENPAVFSALIRQYPQITAICGNGQPRLTTLALMDRMAASGCRFYYAGDYDPEGLVILQNLRQRYRDQLIPWKYSVEYYKKYQSDVIIPEASLKKLDRITIKELLPLAEAIRHDKKAAYQENMRKELLGKDQEEEEI